MSFLLADNVRTDNGNEPSLPAGCGFLLLASIRGESSFSLYDVMLPEGAEATGPGYREVPGSLAILLESGRQFPPALAGAVRELEALGPISREEFLHEMEIRLRRRFDEQPTSPHLLVRSRIDECGYRSVGEYVWVVAYQPERVGREITWIASDFQVYSDAVDTFDVDPGKLAERFAS
jgi:hypothetical protein